MTPSVTRRSFLASSLIALCVPSRLFAADESQVVLRFAAMSDIHFDRSHADASAERVRLGKAIRFMNEFSQAQPYKGFDALVVAGDLSNHGVPEELVPFKKILDDNLRPSTKRVLCMGNHRKLVRRKEIQMVK